MSLNCVSAYSFDSYGDIEKYCSLEIDSTVPATLPRYTAMVYVITPRLSCSITFEKYATDFRNGSAEFHTLIIPRLAFSGVAQFSASLTFTIISVGGAAIVKL